MSSKKRQESLSFAATLIGLVVDLREIIIWLLPVILSLITGITLISQPTPPQVPGFNLKLGAWYQLVLLLSGGLAYLHLLRRTWVNSKSEDDPLSESFKEFFWLDLFRFKRPLLLIPIFLFFVIWLGIGISPFFYGSNEESFVGFMILILLFFALTALIVDFYSSVQITDEIRKWDNDIELKKRWIKRIKYHLQQHGIVTTMDFDNNVGLDATSVKDNEQINWALKMYFLEYEFEQDLTLSDWYYFKLGEEPNHTLIRCYDLGAKQDENTFTDD
jgi:hypothetical protein